MKLNYALICYKELGGDDIQVKHKCCYENRPNEDDIKSLVEELAIDGEFGMVGDDDYKIKLISRVEQPELMKLFDIPEELVQ